MPQQPVVFERHAPAATIRAAALNLKLHQMLHGGDRDE
jgi:hypothetical protein